MSPIEWGGIDWFGRGWLLMLAFTVAVLLTAFLRTPCRRFFGTERAVQLWLLPPLAMLASQLPHGAGTGRAALPAVIYVVTSAVGAGPAMAGAPATIDWRHGAALMWLAGIVISLTLAGLAQSRYRLRLRGATPMPGMLSPWPVLRAASAGVGPALVGAWQARIVVPADFEHRYDDAERTLILAHEAMHARRRDGWWCLLAQIVAAVFWFHPLAWWALGALRHDQELACDAAVMREHGAQRRRYANAMLKTQSVQLMLPVGCPWSPRHPLTERIAMLKLPSPNRLRRHVGTLAGCALAIVVAGSVYAATPPPASHATQVHGEAYQLDMTVAGSTDDGHRRHTETADFALCMGSGATAAANIGGLKVEATAAPAGQGQVGIDLAVTNVGISPPVHKQLHGALGKTLHATGVAADGRHTYAIDVTPQAGCPARMIAEASPVKVTEHVRNGTARAVAASIAAKAGWTLVNPDALGDAPVSLSFNEMPAGTALQRVADLAGKKLVLDGKQVRFDTK